MHAVAVRGRLVALELEPDELALRVRLARDQRLLAEEVAVGVERDREADPGLERVDLVVELVAGEDQPRLDPHHVERVEAERLEPVRRAGRHDRVPHRRGVGRVAEDLVAELAAVARARDDDRDAAEVADPPDEEAEPLELLQLRLVRGRPDDLLEDLAARRPLDGDVVQLVGRRLDPDALEPEPVGELLEVHAVVGVAADEAVVVGAEPEHGRVVDHPAGLVAHGRVDDLAVAQPRDVARHRVLDERPRVGPEDLPLAQGGEVHDRRLLAAGPVLGDGALVGEAGGQPVAAVLGDVAGERGPALVEAGLLGQHGLGLRGDAVRDGHLEAVLRGVDADVDVGGLPPVGGIDVVRAGGRGADEVGHRPHQHVVARPRPRLVGQQHEVRVERRVVEEVQRRPALLAARSPYGSSWRLKFSVQLTWPG